MQLVKQWLMGAMLAALCLAICGCKPDMIQPDRINAHDYQRFWIWGRVNPAPYLSHAHELYVLQGEVGFSKAQQHMVFSAQGMGLSRLAPARVWLVYRTTTLQWSPALMQAIVQRLDSWQHYGNQVTGLQIDFDSATAHVDQYAAFLAKIRQQLPLRYQLSVTGLMDWANAKPAALHNLKTSVNEIVVQTYQGTRTINNYQAYLPALGRLEIPFKIGLVQHGQWAPSHAVEKNPYFKGYVIFLLRQ